MTDKPLTPPAIQPLVGSFFPHIFQRVDYAIITVGGQTLYAGRSYTVARLIAACLTPRML